MDRPTGYDPTHSRFVHAAIALAASVSAHDRITTDPSYPAERSTLADDLRAASLAGMLAEYRAAESALSTASAE